MRENELRIGNFIADYEDKPYHFQIESIENNHGDYWVTYRNGSVNCTVDSLEPIPLTEEWVLKFGFKDLGYGEFEKGRYMLDKEYTDKGFWEFCILGKALPDMEVQYVHQLQNLIFALTGEELTVV